MLHTPLPPVPPLFLLLLLLSCLLLPLVFFLSSRKTGTGMGRETERERERETQEEWLGERPQHRPEHLRNKARGRPMLLHIHNTYTYFFLPIHSAKDRPPTTADGWTCPDGVDYSSKWASHPARVVHAQTPAPSRMLLRRALSSSDQSVSVCPQHHPQLPPPQRESPELGPSMLRPCGSLPDEACSATTLPVPPPQTVMHQWHWGTEVVSRPSTPHLLIAWVLVCCSLHAYCATTLQSRLINAIVLILARPEPSACICVWRPSFKSHPPDPNAWCRQSLPTTWRLKEPGGGGTTPAVIGITRLPRPCLRAIMLPVLSACQPHITLSHIEALSL